MRHHQRLLSFALIAGTLLSCALPGAAQAHTDASAASAASALPVASVVAASGYAAATLSVAGGTLVVKAVESTAQGTVYLLERASDGARASVLIAGKVAGTASVAVGTAVTVTTLGAGLVLSVAGQAIAFIPNAVGKSLLHNQQVAM